MILINNREFSKLKYSDVFPIDVWVRRVMNELYIKNEDETKVSKKEIENLTAMNVENIDIVAKGVHVPEEIEGE